MTSYDDTDCLRARRGGSFRQGEEPGIQVSVLRLHQRTGQLDVQYGLTIRWRSGQKTSRRTRLSSLQILEVPGHALVECAPSESSDTAGVDAITTPEKVSLRGEQWRKRRGQVPPPRVGGACSRRCPCAIITPVGQAGQSIEGFIVAGKRLGRAAGMSRQD
jgi:hypothetical protein